ncbi:hypothetical protein [Phenylobacterium sp.]|jgi:CMP-N-acetylneuraminic acid synthetase|uniref:hypothetical protein n=1 Tax=Phenylobacterium sp. TaxID=1871053 RepID=UPI0025E4BFC7|nr:hypothetical protein [Phenylobacterium sp.]
MSNLRLLNETTATSVSTMSVTDVFTTDFDIYKITLYSSSATEKEDHIQFINSGGSFVNSSSYDYAQLFIRSYSSFSEVSDTSDTKLRLITGSEDNFGGNAIIYVFNPTNSSSYTFILSQMSRGYDLQNDNGFDMDSNKNIGILKQQSSITGFHLFNSSTATSDYTARTYGLRIDT